MTPDFITATAFNLGMNLLHAVLGLIAGVVGLRFVDSVLLKSLDFEEELKKGNIAVAIFASTMLLFIAVLLSFGLRG
ncbi:MULTISPECIES: DUF350 domain-containing protein [Niveibacterium]|uniref:DUF350 domain-containing protein n=1 Tax=Niveibacterium microcysteis TaxID=2811415 RepID=A0ABX7M3F6_9RHOO|nr:MULTISPECIES: DUF350 domain-containing protein [Niveibacterium]QSI75971.1 hypothetical protein JY500_16010 [Niveibacterium microcysteis]